MRLIVNSNYINSIQPNQNEIFITLPEQLYIGQLSLVSASIPYTFYNIGSTNSSFKINSTTYNLENKNYNVAQLINSINLLILSTGVVASYNNQSFKIKFVKATNFTFEPLNMGTILGFYNNQTYTGSSLEGNKCFDMTNGVRSIYIKSNLTDHKILENSTIGTGIIFRIPINSLFGSIITYNSNLDTNLLNTVNQHVNFVHIQLLDNNFNPLLLNGSNFQLEFYLTEGDLTKAQPIILREDIPSIKALKEEDKNEKEKIL